MILSMMSAIVSLATLAHHKTNANGHVDKIKYGKTVASVRKIMQNMITNVSHVLNILHSAIPNVFARRIITGSLISWFVNTCNLALTTQLLSLRMENGLASATSTTI